MEEKKYTWKEIDEEMEKVVADFVASLEPMVARLKKVEEWTKQAPAPATTEEKILKALCVSTLKEYSKTLREIRSHDNLWTESKEQAEKALEKFLGL